MNPAVTISKSEVDAVIFDLDGVVTRTATVHAAAWKRLFDDYLEQRAAREGGSFQPFDADEDYRHYVDGKTLIRRIFQAAAALGASVRVVYLEEYDMALGKYLCAGVDLWLNNPQKPDEASGTSGMKAALNGVPSLSVLDGWWIEGHVEGVTGWSIGDSSEPESDPSKEIASLYDKLDLIVSMFYEQSPAFTRVMRSTIALNGSFYNAQRMLFQYLENAYITD